MADTFDTHSAGLSSPADYQFAVTPNDSADLPNVPRGLYVGGAGDIAMHDKDGTAATWAGLPAGSIIPFRPRRILSTGTTATGIIAIY